MSETVNSNKERGMSIAAELKQGIAELAEPRSPEDNRKSMIARAARRAGINYRTAKALFYEEIPDPKYSIVAAVRGALARKAANQEAKLDVEYRELRERMARLEARLSHMAGSASPQ